jgi:hypothetical protein
MACTTGCPVPPPTPAPSPVPILVGIAVLGTIGSFLLTRPRWRRAR